MKVFIKTMFKEDCMVMTKKKKVHDLIKNINYKSKFLYL